MDPSVIGWVLAAPAVVAAVLLLQRLRTERGRAGELAAELAQAREQLAALQSREEQRTDAGRQRVDELTELRRRIEKLKKRAGERRSDQQNEADTVTKLEQALSQERAEHKATLEELRGVHAQLARARAALDKLEGEVATRPIADAASSEKLAELVRRAELADAAATAALEQAEKARHNEARQRKRADNLDKVYVVLRSEHELLKETFRNQKAELERLRALKVALTDPEPTADRRDVGALGDSPEPV